MSDTLPQEELEYLLNRFKNCLVLPTMIATLAPGQHRRAAGLLCGLQGRGEIHVDLKNMALIQDAMRGGNLIKPEIEITISKGRQYSFSNAMGKMFTGLQLANRHKLNELVTRRIAKQKAFAETLIKECLTTELYQDLAEFGLHCTAELKPDDKMPNITFAIRDNNECIGVIIMDGWSSLLLVSDRTQDNKPSDKTYGGPEEFCAAVWQIIDKYTSRTSATG